MDTDDQIRQLLHTYERSLNTSDAELAASLYTDDAVFMPTTLPTATGAHMQQAYEQIFTAIQLDVTFTIDELVVASDDVAYALTHSNGSQLNRATNDTTTEANREIFIFHRVDHAWKIARYMFNKSE
jgi:uncharacterized protein (TIGR02246 family)